MNGFYMDMRGMPLPSGDIKGFGLSVLKKVESRISLLSVMGIGSNKLISRIITSVVPDIIHEVSPCLLYTSPSPRDGLLSRMPSSA